jgi:hypothetical protein
MNPKYQLQLLQHNARKCCGSGGQPTPSPSSRALSSAGGRRRRRRRRRAARPSRASVDATVRRAKQSLELVDDMRWLFDAALCLEEPEVIVLRVKDALHVIRDVLDLHERDGRLRVGRQLC